MKRTILFVFSLLSFGLLNAQGSWSKKADFPGHERTYEIGFCIGTKCYMGTGVYGTGSPGGGPPLYKDFWEWDSMTNTWTQKADFFGGARSGAIAFAIGNKGYIACGQKSNNTATDLWEYDPLYDTWTQKANLPAVARAYAVAFVIGTKAYVGTGSTQQANVLQDLWEWDQTTNTWTQKANYPGGPRMQAIAFSIGNKGYIGTGADFYNQQKDFWEWDQGTDTWSRKADFIYETFYASGFSIGNKGYVGLGCDTPNISTKFWEWDQSTNTWSLSTNFSGLPRSNSSGFSNNNKGYFGIGIFGQDFWEFDPAGTNGIKEVSFISSMQVFPNPAYNNFSIKYSSNITDKLFLSVKNAMGQVIYSDNDSHFSGIYNKTIELGTNAAGIYFAEIICGRDHRMSKIVLE
jgi:N-acetylneuraminic acid mutarotase